MMNHEPAFPYTAKYCVGHDANNAPIYAEDGFPGMTLRDYFAAKALPKLVTLCAGDDLGGVPFTRYVATKSYELADAMLAERSK